MFASNFPVDKPSASYPTVWRGFDAVTETLRRDRAGRLFRDNASRLYRIARRPPAAPKLPTTGTSVVKIKSIKAFKIPNPISGRHGPGTETTATRGARRGPSRRRGGEPDVALPALQALRATWRGNFAGGRRAWSPPRTAPGASASPATAPGRRLINDHLGPLLVDEDCAGDREALGHDDAHHLALRPPGLASYAISAHRPGAVGPQGASCWSGRSTSCWRPGARRAVLLRHRQRHRLAHGARLPATKLACPYGPADGLDGARPQRGRWWRTRELIGPDVELMLDCWMAFDVEYTVRLAERLRPYRLQVDRGLPAPRGPRRAQGAARAPALADAGDRRALVHALRLRRRRGAAGSSTSSSPTSTGSAASPPASGSPPSPRPPGSQVILHAGMNTPYGQHFDLRAPEHAVGRMLRRRRRRACRWSRRPATRAWRCPRTASARRATPPASAMASRLDAIRGLSAEPTARSTHDVHQGGTQNDPRASDLAGGSWRPP